MCVDLTLVMTTDEPEAKKARAHEKEMDERITVQFQTENGKISAYLWGAL